MSDKRSIGSLLGLVLMFYLLPLRWLGSALIAALIHELGHYCAVRLLGGSVHSLNFRPNGAIMNVSGLSPRAELISLIAGPVAGLLPALAIRTVPTIALCGIIQSAYNLLPIYPLDGGKILHCITLMAGGTEHCWHTIEYAALIMLFLLCIYIQVRFGLSMFLFFVVLLLRKTPCKPQKDWI